MGGAPRAGVIYSRSPAAAVWPLGGITFHGGPTVSSSARQTDEATVLIETPENVTFTFVPAGIGARAIAYGIDLLARGTPLLVLAIILSLTGALLNIANLGAWALAGIIILLFAAQWLYYVFFEFFWNGQTPGKRALGIRVVMDGGYPVTFTAAAVRNFVRLVDLLPSFYLAGVVSAFADRRAKRIGDLAAGTLVVREDPFDVRYLAVIETASAPAGEIAGGRPALTPQQIDLVTRFIERQYGFDEPTRATLAERIAAGISPSLAGASARLDGLLADRKYAEYLEAALGLAEKAAPARGDVGVNRFVKTHKDAWVRLAAFVERIDSSGVKSLSAAELREVTVLYRRAAGDLAYAKTFFARTELTRFLNALMGRAHNHVYRAPASERASLVEFWRSGFPLAFQGNLRFFALSLCIFAAAAAFGAFAFAADERVVSLFLSPSAIDGVREHKLWTHDIFTTVPASFASARILTNNISVTIAAFALGITAGLGTFYVLAMNGMMLGTTLMFTSACGMGYDLMSFVGGHGFIEIFIILVAGAAGLKMGDSILAPGDLTRSEALKLAARDAVLLVLGGAPVLVVAGLIEGFVSPQESIPGWIKIPFGAALLAALVAYLMRPVARKGT
jgi:uncharacterized membrane protein SpoIIM required for sporulation/uncharacterized RDD family membrane protein YckC